MWHRKPVVAGSFYSSNPKTLSRGIDGYLQDSENIKLNGEVIALISPHAGYVYSAPVAAYSFIQLKDIDFQLAIVLAPSHRARFNGASIIPSGIYETPLGNLPIDDQVGNLLMEKPHFQFLKEVHNSEHSLEVQIPFLQKVQNDFKLVPIVIGIVDLDTCREIADEIYNVLEKEKRKFIIIISTDLSHYHSYENACRIDNIFIENLKKFDENSLFDALKSGNTEACGQGSVLTGLSLCKKLGAQRVEILKYANSGDTAGGRDQVVGYLSAAITK